MTPTPLRRPAVPMQVNVREARNRISELLRAVQRGEEVVIAKRGKGIARLAPLNTSAASEPAPPGQAAAFLDSLERHPWPVRPTQTADAERHADIQARIDEQRGCLGHHARERLAARAMDVMDRMGQYVATGGHALSRDELHERR